MQGSRGPSQGSYGGIYPGGYPPPLPRRHRWLSIGLAVMLGLVGVALFLVILTPATFGYHPASGTGFEPWGLFGGFFLIFLIIWVIVWIVRIGMWSSRPRDDYRWRGGRRPGFSAVAIARERYARGEITREQYEQIIETLERRPGIPPLP